jgi:hypothetical protein
MANSLEKLQWQIEKVKEVIDIDKSPIEYMMLELDLDENEFHQILRIIDNYQSKLEENEKFTYTQFKSEIRNISYDKISYQSVKRVIKTFYQRGHKTLCCHLIKIMDYIPVELKETNDKCQKG